MAFNVSELETAQKEVAREGGLVPFFRKKDMAEKESDSKDKGAKNTFRIIPIFGSAVAVTAQHGLTTGERYTVLTSARQWGIKDWFNAEYPELVRSGVSPMFFADWIYDFMSNVSSSKSGQYDDYAKLMYRQVGPYKQNAWKVDKGGLVLAGVNAGKSYVDWPEDYETGSAGIIRFVSLDGLADGVLALLAETLTSGSKANYVTFGKGKDITITKAKVNGKVSYSVGAGEEDSYMLPEYLRDPNLEIYKLGDLLYSKLPSLDVQVKRVQEFFGMSEGTINKLKDKFEQAEGAILDKHFPHIVEFCNDLAVKQIKHSLKADLGLSVGGTKAAKAHDEDEDVDYVPKVKAKKAVEEYPDGELPPAKAKKPVDEDVQEAKAKKQVVVDDDDDVDTPPTTKARRNTFADDAE